MTAVVSLKKIVVEYTPITINQQTEYAVMSDTIQMVVDQGAVHVSDVTVPMINRVAELIDEMEPQPDDPRTAADRLEELYVFGLCVLGLVPDELTSVSARLCRAHHQAYIRRLAEHAKKYRNSMMPA